MKYNGFIELQFWMIAVLIIINNFLVQGSLVFIESKNITQTQTADYQCYIGIEGVTIQWHVDGTPSTSEKVTSLGIVTTGAATSNSSLSIPGAAISAGSTIVTCIASGLVNEEFYNNKSSATLYIQGKPRVDRLDCSLQQTFFTIKCRWNESYVIEGIHITKYRLELENGAQKLNTSLLPNDKLEYEYDASASGEHKISIIPYIDTLEGEAANRSVVIDTDWITEHQTRVLYEEETWMLAFQLNTKNTTWYGNPPPQEVKGCVVNGTSNSTYCPFSGSTTSENSTNQITGELPLEDNERNNVTIMLLYSSGIDVKLNDSIELSTFDVQSGSVDIKGLNEVCFNCIFIDGSNAIGCQVLMVYNETDSRELNITRTDDYSESSGCINDLTNTTIIDSVLFYDIESDGSVSSSMPALELFVSEFIMYDVHSDQSIHSVVDSTPTSHVEITTTTASPTESILDPGQNVVAVIVGITCAIVGLVIVVGGMLIALAGMKRKKNVKLSSTVNCRPKPI